jgi:hypothetical protein
VIHARNSNGEGLIFMPFSLRRTALIVSWEPGSSAARQGALHVEWNRPIVSQKVVRMFGAEMHLLRFDGIDESLLLIPLGAKRVTLAQSQLLSGSNAWVLVSLESSCKLEQVVSEFNTWRAGLTARALAKREIEELDRWRVKPSVHFTSEQERHLWRQSEVMLRMAQSREPNRPGRNNNGPGCATWPARWLPSSAWATRPKRAPA